MKSQSANPWKRSSHVPKAKAKSPKKKGRTSGRSKSAGSKKSDAWKSHPVSISFRGKTYAGKIGIAVPGMSPEVYDKFFELASLCAQHAARFQPGT